MTGLSNSAELRAQVWARGGAGENISGTVCNDLQERYLTEQRMSAGDRWIFLQSASALAG